MSSSVLSVLAATALFVVHSQQEGARIVPSAANFTDCGVSSKNLHPLATGGRPTTQGEFPWLAAIYLRNDALEWEQQCGGTLISNHIVLTAAHCLVNSKGIVSTDDIKIGLGKYFRDFHRNESNSLIVDVKEVVVPKGFAGGVSYYSLDIGLVDLAVPVHQTAFITPACVDWTYSVKINASVIGHAVGWGTTENRTSSQISLAAELAYINHTTCVKKVREVYRRYITHDKFCAESTNGGQVDKGDSGGGLTVVKDGRHYVVGVVSTKFIDQTTYSLFTDVTNSEHLLWFRNEKARLDDAEFKERYLLVTTKGMRIERFSLRPTERQQFSQLLDPEWVTTPQVVDCVTGLMYWYGSSGDVFKIRSATLDGENITDFFHEGIGHADSLTLDWVGRKLYFIDSTQNKIKATDLETAKTKTIISRLKIFSVDLVVHPSLRKIYWITQYQYTRTWVDSANLDGTGRKEFESKNVHSAATLVIDWATDDLCWAQSTYRKIVCKNLISGVRRTVATFDEKEPTRLAITPYKYYWAESDGKEVYVISRTSSKEEEIIRVDLQMHDTIEHISIVSETCPHLSQHQINSSAS